MEWVETTGPTVESAKEAALDRLGVDEQDAEFEVLEEPRSGLFGRTRGVGRVRARVVPRSPRPKPERRRRSRGDRPDQRNKQSDRGEESPGSTGSGDSGGAPGSHKGGSTKRRSGARDAAVRSTDPSTREAVTKQDTGERQSGGRSSQKKEREMMDATSQCEVVTEFLDGLANAMGLEVNTSASMDGEVLLAVMEGSEVGLLIGPKLGTLDAIQEIARNVLQRHAEDRGYAKVVVDVAGVREMRRTALAAFVNDAVRRVIDEGEEVTFEVMSSADRKVVHDTVAELDGVSSGSIGEDPRRRVVIRPS